MRNNLVKLSATYCGELKNYENYCYIVFIFYQKRLAEKIKQTYIIILCVTIWSNNLLPSFSKSTFLISSQHTSQYMVTPGLNDQERKPNVGVFDQYQRKSVCAALEAHLTLEILYLGRSEI